MKVLELLKKIPGKNNLLLAIILFLVVWFILPHITLNGVQPFSSVEARLLVLAVIALAWLIKIGISLLQKHKTKALPMVIEKLKRAGTAIKNLCLWLFTSSKTNFKEFKYKVQRDKQKRRLRRLPWYLVLGAPQSGKKTLLANFGLYYAQPEHFGEDAINYINQHPDFEWWFSEQAVLIDPINKDKERDTLGWKKLLKLLKKERSHKPLNGIILTFSLADLLLYSNQNRQEFIQDVCRYIRDLHETFKSLVPVYFVLTKCDQVEGFMEFFNDMSKEELNQVWGMTLPYHECTDLNAVRAFFTKEYNNLINQLRKRVLWAFDTERNLRGRELILSFPQQMQLLKKPLESFLLELFGATRYQKALQMRGLYFISSKQEGEPYDFLLQAMSKKFQLVPPTVHRPQRMGECYFARSLIHEVIFPEAPILGDSERSKRIRSIAYRLCTIAAPLLVLLAGVAMYQGYQDNVANLNLVDNHIANYQNGLTTLDQTNPSLTTILPLLDELNAAHNLYRNKPLAMDSLYESGAIGSTLDDTLQRALHSLFLPRIAAEIETSLNQNISDQNLLYATLKGYLAFSASDYSKSSAVKAPMEYSWNKDYLTQAATESKLKYYLDTATQEPIEKLPLDRNLINRIRGQLEAIVPSNRAYGLLELGSTVSDLPDLMLSTAVGGSYNSVFTSNGNVSVPELYTRSGYETNFLKQYGNIADEVAQDNQDIGLANDSDDTQNGDQIAQVMEINYNKNYINNWQQALANIQVAQFTNLQQAVDALNSLTSKQSPLPKLLSIIYDNTNSVDNKDKVQVDKAFAALNAYSQNQSDNVSWQQTQNTLIDLSKYLNNIANAANPNAAALQAAQDVISGKANPIQDLSEQAKSAPEPVQDWLNAIANNCWQIIVMSAHTQLNSMWAQQVMGQYNAAISGRYPLVENSQSQIAIDDFNQFFSNDGTLAAYFNTYVKPFVNMSGTTWTLASVDGHTIQIPDDSIALFQQAQTIRDEFFPNGAKQAALNLSIKPLTLDSNASNMQLVLGSQSLNYSHGPQFPMIVTWPLPFNNQMAQLIVNSFSNDQYTNSASGPWALFKLLEYGNLTETTSNGNYELDFNLNGLIASFTLSGSADMDTYRLTALKGLSLPNEIAPNPDAQSVSQ